MANSRTEGGPLPRWSKRWWWWCVWWWWWWGCSCVGVEGKEECGEDTNVAVVVVISVFVTLVVVAIVLVVVYLVLRRRHGGFLFPPKRTRKSLMGAEEDANRIVSRDGCYDNPIFPARDTVDLEEGMVSASSKRNASPGKSVNQGPPQKKRSSAGVPQDVPDGPRRKVSGGSLDNHSGPETVTVCLQSQDIIGLGFNISGNMRDGIYVSQLHNRGPAIESGHIQVGDRIRSVTIAYDNMVYEDALTILSYASPYPVKVTLQKERAPATDPRPGISEQIHHPIYRSQSLDTLPHLPKEFQFKAKRWQSEMKSETRKDSPKRGEAERRVKALSQSLPPLGWGAPVPDILDVHSDVMVHAADSADGSPDPAWYRLNQERTTPVKKEALNSSQSSSASKPGEDSQPAKTRKKGKLEKQAAQGIEILGQMVDKKEEDDDTFWSQTAAIVSSSPKTPPNKPERKKKNSSSSIVSEDMSFEFGNSPVEEVCVAVKRAQVHALPPGLQDEGPEVEEEEIQPTHIKREVVINAEGFEFSPVEKQDPEAEAERPRSPNRFAYMTSPARPASPEGDPVEEEPIEAAVASRDIQMAPPSYSARAQGRNSYNKTQGVSSLDDGSLENLILKNPLTRTSHDSDQRDTRQGLEENRSGFLLQNDAHQSSQDSDDFVTVDLSDMSRPSDRLKFNSSESDSQLQRYSEDNKENCVDDLEWSGQRLVRSGSFTEIAHADSVSDWTDRNTFNDDDDTSPTSGKSSAADNYADLESEVTPSTILPSNSMFKGRENLSNLSDLSNSISSSRSSSPGLTNGPVSEGVAVLLPGSSGKHTTTIDMLPTSDSNANSKTVNFIVNYSADNDADC